MNDRVLVFSLHDRDAWIAAHRDCGLPTQSWHYARALSASGVEPKLAVVDADGARMLLPFFEREWRGSIDIASLIGSSASITPGNAAPLALWHEYAADRGWVAGYMQMSTTTDLRENDVAGELIDINEWFELDIERENLQRTFSETVRQKIKAADISAVSLVEDRTRLTDSLIELFPVLMARLGARSRYQFAPETLNEWANAPSALLLGADLGTGIEAVSLFLVHRDQAEYQLNACSERGRDLAAWLIWNAIVRLQPLGVRTLHLGGGVRRGDGLYQFKQKFHGMAKPLRAVRQIYHPAKYQQLCAEAGRTFAGDWFPAYRSPVD